MSKNIKACPCGHLDYEQCCGLYLNHQQMAPNAEALMRSRYSAFVEKNEAYLQKTWHPRTRPDGQVLSNDDNTQWLGLTVFDGVKSAAPNLVQDQVTFIAKYKVNGRAYKMHEVSDFVYENGQWFYVSGLFSEG
jgi:SEC-C motif-containing protein